ncbi:MAG: protein kinase, partial [Oscillospiraceae bacterium]
MDRYTGKKLDGRYEILELIGVGGMANVYRARDVVDGKIVAVKILKSEFAENEEFLRRFKNESRAIAMLSHDNIVKVYDVSFTEKVHFIVMEFIDGITLKEYIAQQGKLSWKEATYYTMQILRALSHAHDNGIVHRDIKPQNVMLLSDGTIKITDFGIARFARSETKTLTDRAIGSVHYISPEQASGAVIDQRTDLYSVGVVLFEMVTGTLPFDADTPISVALKQIQAVPKRPRELNPEIPEGLEEIVMRAMQKAPSKRYQTAAEMLKDFEEFKKNPSVSFQYDYLDAE